MIKLTILVVLMVFKFLIYYAVEYLSVSGSGDTFLRHSKENILFSIMKHQGKVTTFISLS
ncbi:MAG TPA: hypothetical protein VE089_06815 [Nitrososphaeraceae archaeon]|nr:hypothetical protein [Nitrososphaeraceae archaeon]